MLTPPVERNRPCLFIAWCLAHVIADGFHRTAHTQRLMDRRSKRITPFQSIWSELIFRLSALEIAWWEEIDSVLTHAASSGR